MDKGGGSPGKISKDPRTFRHHIDINTNLFSLQLFFQITIFARLGFQFLGFFGATIYSWSLLQKPYVDTAVVRARGVFNSAKTVVIEMADISVQLHSRLEAMFGSTLAAYCVDGFLVSAVLLLLLRMSAVMITILYPAVDCLWNVGRRVYWRGTFLLFIASIVGYIGYLWTKVVWTWGASTGLAQNKASRARVLFGHAFLEQWRRNTCCVLLNLLTNIQSYPFTAFSTYVRNTPNSLRITSAFPTTASLLAWTLFDYRSRSLITVSSTRSCAL